MRKNFWQKLDRPFFCLAPMSDVTDVAFRTMLATYSKTAENKNKVVFWTEFVSADGLCHVSGRRKLMHILKFSKVEKPIVAQIFGAKPENIKKACQIISKLGPSRGRAGFDGIDINMGCPDKSIIKQGAGSALIKNSKLAREIIRSAIAGANGLPISIKTRVGFNKEEIDPWISELLQEDISALTIHARTKKEMSKVPANWDFIKKVVELVKKSGKKILVIGNGDITNTYEAMRKCEETGCDGVMIGRGVFGNPWVFFDSGQGLSLALEGESLSSKNKKIKALVEHIKIFDKKLLKTGDKNYA
ncbi:MAG: hypothetical protein A2541_00620, partial [Candidatus Taylorbacteria bacterium RIFOXYD2_FULL_36_9]